MALANVKETFSEDLRDILKQNTREPSLIFMKSYLVQLETSYAVHSRGSLLHLIDLLGEELLFRVLLHATKLSLCEGTQQ